MASYLHVLNLYKQKNILLFKEVYCLEKIHGTSSSISWNHETQEVTFYQGGVSLNSFIALFNPANLKNKFAELFPDVSVTVYGEAYGGSCQKMSATYGKDLKFVAFDVKVNDIWLNVPNAEDVVTKLGLEFVAYAQVSTDLASLDAERDADSTQALRNGMGAGKKREGVVIRPLQEFFDNRGERVIVKHKRDEFKETATPRVVSDEKLQVLTEAKAIADEWCTEQRLLHVLDKLPQDIGMESTKLVIKAMVEDVYREAEGEIVESKEVTAAIGQKTVALFKQKVQKV
jgi:hypothetical protein